MPIQNIPNPLTIIDATKALTPYTKAVGYYSGFPKSFEACRAMMFSGSTTVTFRTVDDQDNPITNFPVISGQIYKISAVQIDSVTIGNAFVLY